MKHLTVAIFIVGALAITGCSSEEDCAGGQCEELLSETPADAEDDTNVELCSDVCAGEFGCMLEGEPGEYGKPTICLNVCRTDLSNDERECLASVACEEPIDHCFE